jgi:hypothetical protein
VPPGLGPNETLDFYMFGNEHTLRTSKVKMTVTAMGLDAHALSLPNKYLYVRVRS